MNISELQDLMLTEREWSTLATLWNIEKDAAGCGIATPEAKREWCRANKSDLDILILAGLVRRGGICDGTTGEITWLDSCFTTVNGRNAASAMDMVLDWEEVAFAPSEAAESPCAGSEEVESV